MSLKCTQYQFPLSFSVPLKSHISFTQTVLPPEIQKNLIAEITSIFANPNFCVVIIIHTLFIQDISAIIKLISYIGYPEEQNLILRIYYIRFRNVMTTILKCVELFEFHKRISFRIS